MESPATDPKAGERAYYRRLGEAGLAHARGKPFSDPECGKYLADLGALLAMMEPPPRRVLDLGCGTGWTSLFLARAGYEVTGVDLAGEAVTVARELAAEAGLANVRFEAADYESFAAENAFDYVLFYDALHHAEDETAALRTAYRALKPGGLVFAFEPGAGHHRSPGAQKAIATYGVHEKDMPPAKVWRLGRAAGFRKALFLPLPRQIGSSLYRRDYLRTDADGGLWRERLWGYLRALGRALFARRSGLLLMWK
jgi:SAM-dependent methyltransferase